MHNNGFLTVNSRTALGALPVGGACVHVTGDGIDATFYTDSSGATGRIVLPAPQPDASLSPEENGAPFSSYDIEVSADGYYTVLSRAVPVFPGITSVQNVNLIPVAAYGFENKPEDSLVIDECIQGPGGEQ